MVVRPVIAVPLLLAFTLVLSLSASADTPVPHMAYGYVVDEGGSPAPNSQVTVTNSRTGETATPSDDANLSTDSAGRYSVDLGDPVLFPSGWAEGDAIRVSAIGAEGYGQRSEVYRDGVAAQQLNVELSPLPPTGDSDDDKPLLPDWAWWVLGGGAVLLLGFLAYWLLVPQRE